jgi:uncharacterized flavoprotein (TIGR03862 family)
LMASEVLSAAGLAVEVYDHKPSVGRKFLLAGRSGLNLTHSEPFEHLLCRYDVAARPRLVAALRAFTPDDLRTWSAGLGEPTFVGSSGRVFPQSMRATPLLRAWLERLAAQGVKVRSRHRWAGWDGDPQQGRLAFTDADGTHATVHADVVVLALGGASWPRVGSDGTWVSLLTDAGIDVTPLTASNAGWDIAWTPLFSDRYGGVPLKNVAVRIEGQPAAAVRGDVMITWTGMEGGPVYALSAAVRSALAEQGRATAIVDLHPDLTVTDVAGRLERRRPKDSLTTTLTRTLGLAPVAVGLMREGVGVSLPSESKALARLVKGAPVPVRALMPIDKAISTAGGIALHEIDDAFMLRHLPGTFVAGEMLDWDAPTGGYLLQATFSTAVAAANGAIAWLCGNQVTS